MKIDEQILEIITIPSSFATSILRNACTEQLVYRLSHVKMMILYLMQRFLTSVLWIRKVPPSFSLSFSKFNPGIVSLFLISLCFAGWSSNCRRRREPQVWDLYTSLFRDKRRLVKLRYLCLEFGISHEIISSHNIFCMIFLHI